MRILEMTASFGCLDRATLTLEDGVNVLRLPNEGGKSTWAAFLTAMFYGLDGSQRAAKGRLPEKSRYQPWSGAPMEGTVTLERQGRRLVLQRTSERGRPMGVFRAYDLDTGLDVPGLTGENCGKALLGVERSVFQRSAFLSGGDLTVTQDQALARRLGNLAASGAETDSYPAAEARLRAWKNRCRYHKTGLLPETEARLRQTQEALETAADLRGQRLRVTQELNALREQDRRQSRQAQAAWEARRREVREALAQAHSQAEAQGARTAALPALEELLSLAGKLEGRSPPAPSATCPPALAGLEEDAVLPKAQEDLREYDRLTAEKKRRTGGLLLAAALLSLGAAVALLLRRWLPGLCLLALAAAAFGPWTLLLRRGRRIDRNLEGAEALLRQYGVEHRDRLLPAAMAWRDVLRAQAQDRLQEWETARLLDQVAAFAPGTETVEAARAAVREAVALRRADQACQLALERAELQWQALSGGPPQNQAYQVRCAALEAQAAALARQETALGGWEVLDARRQALEAELAEWKRREAALSLAQEALEAAERQMEQVYAPQLTGLAGDCLEKLTQGRYDGLVLRQDFTLLVREAASGLARPLAALSRGTQDQTWLALRLAMTRALLPADVPVVLDDALLTFDETRTRAALDLLTREGRQVLLFSCRKI